MILRLEAAVGTPAGCEKPAPILERLMSDEAEYNAGVQLERERALTILRAAGDDPHRWTIAATAIIQGLSIEQGLAMIESAARTH